MEIIKFWHFMCKVLFGKTTGEQVGLLLDLYNSHDDKTPKWNLSGLKKGHFKKSYLYRILKTWFGSYVPTKKLLAKVLEHDASTLIYLESSGNRRLEWERYELEAIEGIKPGMLRYLTRQLPSKFEVKLLEEGDRDKIGIYTSKFALSLPAERKFIRLLSANPIETTGYYLHFTAWRYIEEHPDTAFSKTDAQQLLFELSGCEDVQGRLISKSTMLNPSLRDVAIEILIDKAFRNVKASNLLKQFLSLSCIENEALLEKFQHSHLDIHLGGMLTISQIRQNVLMTLTQYGYSTFKDRPYLYSHEKEIMVMVEGDERRNLVMEQLVPELEKGNVTPACAAWIAWQYPKLTQTAQNGINLFMRRVIDDMNRCEMFTRLHTRIDQI